MEKRNIFEKNLDDENIELEAEQIKEVVKSYKKPKEVNVSSKYPAELTNIFKTLGMHSPVGIRPPNSAKNRAKSNMIRKAARGR